MRLQALVVKYYSDLNKPDHNNYFTVLDSVNKHGRNGDKQELTVNGDKQELTVNGDLIRGICNMELVWSFNRAILLSWTIISGQSGVDRSLHEHS